LADAVGTERHGASCWNDGIVLARAHGRKPMGDDATTQHERLTLSAMLPLQGKTNIDIGVAQKMDLGLIRLSANQDKIA